ncbi:MAG: hypothetical protein BGN86_00880, partial [Caulobacterales bacterium 68-7]
MGRTAFSAWLGLTFFAGLSLGAPNAQAQVPDPLVFANGAAVRSKADFEQRRRPEILNLFAENVYGRTPKGRMPLKVIEVRQELALNGLAFRKQITLAVGPKGERTWRLLLYIPANAKGPVPTIVGLNFAGNHTVDADPGIDLNPVWVRDPAAPNPMPAGQTARQVLQPATAATRGRAAANWQVAMLMKRGYGFATIYAGDIEPDFDGGVAHGIRPLFQHTAQTLDAADAWGAMGAWAWGMSRVADVVSDDRSVDSRRLIAFGFSRFGKAALWAAAQDKRFALVLANETGKGGASLVKHPGGETLDHVIEAFPYWNSTNLKRFYGRVNDLPVDGHLLLALITPRPLYVGSADKDPYSDPEGEYLATKAVTPVYALYGEQGLPDGPMPALD